MTTVALFLAVCLSPLGFAQTPSPIFAQVEKAIAEKEPTWKLAGRLISRKGQIVSYQWKSKKSSVKALIFVYETPEEAAKTYHNFDLEVFGLKRTPLEGARLDLGDENYVWKESGDGGLSGIDFRKGKVFVHINAPMIESAKRFAYIIAETLPAT